MDTLIFVASRVSPAAMAPTCRRRVCQSRFLEEVPAAVGGGSWAGRGRVARGPHDRVGDGRPRPSSDAKPRSRRIYPLFLRRDEDQSAAWNPARVKAEDSDFQLANYNSIDNIAEFFLRRGARSLTFPENNG